MEVGEYLERIFPLLQVRFISVNDGYDSSAKQYGAAGDLDVGMRNLINELYSRTPSGASVSIHILSMDMSKGPRTAAGWRSTRPRPIRYV